MLQASIKRLTRPKFRHEFTTLYNPKQFQAIPLLTQNEIDQEMQNVDDLQ